MVSEEQGHGSSVKHGRRFVQHLISSILHECKIMLSSQRSNNRQLPERLRSLTDYSPFIHLLRPAAGYLDSKHFFTKLSPLKAFLWAYISAPERNLATSAHEGNMVDLEYGAPRLRTLEQGVEWRRNHEPNELELSCEQLCVITRSIRGNVGKTGPTAIDA